MQPTILKSLSVAFALTVLTISILAASGSTALIGARTEMPWRSKPDVLSFFSDP
jgi:hypothetical protein